MESGKDTYQRPKRFSALSHFLITVGVFLLSFIFFYQMGTAIVFLIEGESLAGMQDLEKVQELTSTTYAMRLVNFIGSAFAMFFAAMASTKLFRAESWNYLSADYFGQTKWFLYSVLFFIVSLPVMNFLIGWNQGWDLSLWSESMVDWVKQLEDTNNRAYETMIGNGTSMDLIINLFLMAIAPAIAEEFLFRGVILKTLFGLFKNVHIAIFVTALLFALLHLQPLKIVPMTLLAMVLGYMVYWTGSLWPAILVHFGNNAMAVLSLHYQTDGDYEELLRTEGSYPLWLTLVSAVLIIGLFVFMQRKAQPKLKNFYV